MQTEKKVKDVVFYSERLGVTITYYPKAEDSKQITLKHPETGEIRRDHRGRPMYQHNTVKFSPLSTTKGSSYASCLVITPEMESREEIIAAVERAMKDAGNKIFTEAQWEKRKNPAAFEEVQRRQKIENELDVTEKKLEAAQAEIARLKSGGLRK